MPASKPSERYVTDDFRCMQQYILFAHAFAGCDTTSAFFSIGKRSILNTLKGNENIELATVFYETGKNGKDNKDDSYLYDAAERMVKLLCKCKDPKEDIESVRYRLYKKSISSKKKFELSQLPPTKSALRQHVKRVYFQIQAWLGENLVAEDWGWKRKVFMLVPIMIDESTVPPEILSQVSCENIFRC